MPQSRTFSMLNLPVELLKGQRWPENKKVSFVEIVSEHCMQIRAELEKRFSKQHSTHALTPSTHAFHHSAHSLNHNTHNASAPNHSGATPSNEHDIAVQAQLLNNTDDAHMHASPPHMQHMHAPASHTAPPPSTSTHARDVFPLSSVARVLPSSIAQRNEAYNEAVRAEQYTAADQPLVGHPSFKFILTSLSADDRKLTHTCAKVRRMSLREIRKGCSRIKWCSMGRRQRRWHFARGG